MSWESGITSSSNIIHQVRTGKFGEYIGREETFTVGNESNPGGMVSSFDFFVQLLGDLIHKSQILSRNNEKELIL